MGCLKMDLCGEKWVTDHLSYDVALGPPKL
jgi:hypothetical protein